MVTRTYNNFARLRKRLKLYRIFRTKLRANNRYPPNKALKVKDFKYSA